MGMRSHLENGPGPPAPRFSSLFPGRAGFAWQCVVPPSSPPQPGPRPPYPSPLQAPICRAGLHSPRLDPDVRKNLILPASLLLLKLILEMREQTLHNSHGLDIRYSDKYTPLMSNYHIITFQLARIMMN